MLKEGQTAPAFKLKDQSGNDVSLSSFRGRKTVVYFYPKDHTPGCTRQACAFRDAYSAFQENGIAVIGISKDSVSSHKKFSERLELPFTLLADPDLEAIKAYGVWTEKKRFGKTYIGVSRTTFVLDEEGRILKIFENADPNNNAQEILALF